MSAKPQHLEVIEGGKSIEPKSAGSDASGQDWLRDLEYGARFLSRAKQFKGFIIDNYGIAMKLDEAILLADFGAVPGQRPALWVDSKEFSRLNRFVALLPEQQPDEEPGDNNEHHLPRPADGKDHD
jgi:hypothetical protein